MAARGLPCHPSWFRRSPCRSVGVQESSFGVSGCGSAVGDFVFSGVLHSYPNSERSRDQRALARLAMR